MKKSNFGYVAMWYGGAFLLVVLLGGIGWVVKSTGLMLAAMALFVLVIIFVPIIIRKRMENGALKLEESFAQKGFTYHHKFTSNSGIFYIDRGGRLGVVWRDNPTQFQFADLTKLSDVRTSNGKQLRGTSLVSCQFKLEGKKYKIYTLRVSNGQLAMKDPRVVEAIEKADNLCAMLKEAGNAASGRN